MKKTYTNKKIAVDAYFFNNFGDDLFLEILVNRYPDAYFDFITPSEDRMKNFSDHPRISRVSRKQALINVNSYEMYIMIGGSMFQQPPNWKMQWLNLYLMVKTFKSLKKKCAIIGCNFGPFSNPFYVKAYKYIFKKLDCLSVRDEKSFNVLKDEKININCYPDMAFSFDVDTYKTNINTLDETEKFIGVSIMDFGKENVLYENKMAEIINSLQKYAKVKIFSFQNSSEINDLKIINKVLSKIPSEDQNFEVVNYDGNMKEFLHHYGECKAFLTTRFHSLILSLMYNQRIVAINYNPKIENTLNYLKIDLETVDLDKLDTLNIASLVEDEQKSYDLKNIKDLSIEHFKYIDSALRG